MRSVNRMKVSLNIHQYHEHEHLNVDSGADSLAGQMNALKTGGLSSPAPVKKTKKPVVVESDDDESDTDGEVGDESDTDTDTDTDGE